jgi:enamine deaminase RidA (YjgF/YER057c/UK114 family)
MPISTRSILSLLIAILAGQLVSCRTQPVASSSGKVRYFGNPTAVISSAVVVPANRKYYWSSGVVSPVLDPSAPEGTREKHGDTKSQAIGILNRLQDSLSTQGLTFRDVTYLRVYVAPDKFNNNQIDFKGWFEAYARFFGTAENPTKPSRSTLGVASLVSTDKLIEIELVAVYPE